METQPTTPECHIVSVPFPGRGHINPMMNLCRTIATKQPNILITFVVTEEWFGLISKDLHSKPENIDFATIPNVLPSEQIRARNFQEFVDAVMNKMEGPFEQVLDRIRHPRPSVIVADSLLFWAVKIGNRRDVPVALLTTCSMTAFELYYRTLYLSQLERQTSSANLSEKGAWPQKKVEKGNDHLDDPSETPTEGSTNQPTPGKEEDQGLQWMRLVYSSLPNAQYLLFASIEELEQRAFDALRPRFSIPLYTVGPNIPYFQLEEKPSSNPKQNEVDHLQWLDSQVSDSVLYVSFGSYLPISTTRMNEIAAALCTSGIRFLWAARGESTTLTKLVGSNGIVVPWCEQLRVLTHHSIGGLWTHCGWGSVMEGIFAGVPILASPIGMEQDVNCKLIVEDWKMGWRVNAETSSNSEGLLIKFMDQQDDESKAIRKRAKELQEICQQVIRTNGSSEVNINAFIGDIVQGHGQ